MKKRELAVLFLLPFLAWITSGEALATIPAPDDVAAPPADAEVTDSGLASKVLTVGTGGAKPEARDTVTVHYTGWTTDGKMFDSSVTRKKPSTFGLKQVIKGWTEGLQLMVVGEKRRFWIPESLAYKGQKGRPAGMLVFDVELLEVTQPPAAPEDVAAAPEDAEVSDSGLASRRLVAGTGSDHPITTDTVSVHYTGWTTDGDMFDSSVTRDKPSTFQLNRVIKGWTEGLQLMVEGEKRRFWIPDSLAYKGKRGPQGTLVFDVELLEILTPKAPADVAAPPTGAEVTKSGLASKVLEPGSGARNPTPDSRVTVHYTGWTTDGKMFDSSVVRGKPSTFGLRQVIKGWTEGLQLMVEGEKRLFWIPQKLAYRGQPGKPAGMLVFEVELIEIVE
ncbi:MAG: FKBP-type peptidylprolyl isomerase [bacterium]|nr:FKBP-type peptidylprolyl isomerase [bacterium]